MAFRVTENNVIPQKTFQLAFSCAGAVETFNQLIETNPLIYNIAILGKNKMLWYVTLLGPKS